MQLISKYVLHWINPPAQNNIFKTTTLRQFSRIHATNRRKRTSTQSRNPLISFNCKLTYYMTNIKIKLTIRSIIARVIWYVCMLSSSPRGDRSASAVSWLSACCQCLSKDVSFTHRPRSVPLSVSLTLLPYARLFFEVSTRPIPSGIQKMIR